MIRLSLSAVVLSSLIVFAAPVAAQSSVTQSPAAARVDAPDRLDSKQAGISRAALAQHARRVDTAPAGATASVVQSRVRRGQTLMIVGGAAFLAGLIIGDDAGTAVAVGGAVIGLYGLYLWAQTQ
jgi:hypothetical protein